MISQCISFWRRFVGKGDSPAKASAKDDRRFWVRYPADMLTTVQVVDQPVESRVPARIRDMSRGGINLLVDQTFQPGQLLSLEMPNPDDPKHAFQMLACVVRADAEPGGRKSLGCVFSRELSDDDLITFGARRARHAPDDQRAWTRFPCEIHATFSTVGEPDSAMAHPAQVSNISASGVGLEVNEAINVGALLNLKLVGHHANEKTLLACVVHAVQKDDATWQLGCNFIHVLSEDEFQNMI